MNVKFVISLVTWHTFNLKEIASDLINIVSYLFAKILGRKKYKKDRASLESVISQTPNINKQMLP